MRDGDYGGYTLAEIAELLEWDWSFLWNGEVLHHVAEIIGPAEDPGWVGVSGRTTCGRTGTLRIPGLLMRMGWRRCSQCSDKLGWPRGTGSPKNDDGLRPLVMERVSAP